ncbi:TipJ family phage tail tip protein [Pseudomonas sp. RT6P73]
MGAVAKKRRSVTGAKGGQAKQKQPSIATNSVPSIATARIVYLWSWGPIVGPVNGLQSVRLDGTPIQAPDGTINYPGVKWQFRSGELNQARLAGVSESSNEIAVGQELLTTAPWLHTINNAMIDALRLRFSWPQLQSQDSSGNINGVRIDYAVDISTDNGPYVQVLTSFVDRKNITKYERSHRLELPEGSSWTVRARRLTPEANSSLVQDGMVVEAVAEVVDSDQEYPLTSVGCIEYDAQQFGGDIAKIAVLMRGRIVRVPTNYNPETRTYATGGAGTSNGVWDGTFKEAYTNNPAWVFYDLVLHPYYGLGERIDATMVDRWSLYRIAQYCDQMVPDGKGGHEPRFTCNLYFQKQAEAYAVLQDLASIFHGMAYWDGSQVVVNADMPGDPVFSYSPAQILNNGAIQYDGTRWRDRHTNAMVSWDNPGQGFETDKEPVFDDEALSELGSVRELAVDAFGCTSLGQAQRAGQWALLTEQLQTRGGTFRVGLDGHIPKPGQVIAVGDPMLAGRANGGRISSVNGRVITLDRDLEIPTGARLLLNLPSGKSEGRVIKSFAGRAVTVMADYSEVPEAECGWVIDFDDLKVMQFYVRNVTRPEWHQFQIEAIQHEPSKFDAIDFGAVVDTRPISGIPIGTQEAPARVLLSQHVVIEQGIAVTNMTIAWDAAPGAVGYDVEWRWGAREWIKVPRTGELAVDVRGIYSGQYLARVRAVSAMNVSSIPTNSVLTDLLGKTGLPPSVAHLIATPLLFGINLKWGFPAGAEDTQRTEIWYGASTSLEAATKLADLAYPQKEYSMQGLRAGVTFFFWARLVDRTGNIGPFYPIGLGVMGQSSSDVSAILEMIAGQIGETELGQDLLDEINKIPGLQEQIDALDDILLYDPSKTYVDEDMVRMGQRLYQATQAVPLDTPPPNLAYWLDIGKSIETANGLAEQVAFNTADITELDGMVTAQATAFQALRASYRDDNGEGDLADALKGWTSTAAIAREEKVRASENEAMAQITTTLDAKVGQNAANLTTLEQVVATNNSATSTKIDQLSVTIGQNGSAIQQNTAAIQQTATAYADTSGKLSTMWSVKMQVNAQGQYVAAGIGLGIENGPAGLQSTFLVSADTFAVVNGINGTLSSPFAVTGGQVFIRSAFIENGSINMLKIGDTLQSDNYVAGSTGWRLTKAGVFEINGNVAGAGRMTMTNNALKVYDANGVKRVQLGDLNA